MLQSEDLSAEMLLSMFDDPPQPTVLAPPPQPQQTAFTNRLPAKQVSLGRPSSVFSSEGSMGSNIRLDSGEFAVPEQDQQQQYAARFQELMPHPAQLVRDVFGPDPTASMLCYSLLCNCKALLHCEASTAWSHAEG